MIGIIDYGAGNLQSVLQAVERSGFPNVQVARNPALASSFTSLLLPGVGSFPIAMSNLEKTGWSTAIKQHAQDDKQLIGICLGMQLLLSGSDEAGGAEGLDLIPGHVELLPVQNDFQLPHIGWNEVYWTKNHPICASIPSGLDFYHVHSYFCNVKSTEHVIGTTHYPDPFPSVLAKQNILGFQFHPEKSHPVGLRLLSNSLNLANTIC